MLSRFHSCHKRYGLGTSVFVYGVCCTEAANLEACCRYVIVTVRPEVRLVLYKIEN